MPAGQAGENMRPELGGGVRRIRGRVESWCVLSWGGAWVQARTQGQGEWWPRVARETQTLHFNAKLPDFKNTVAMKEKLPCPGFGP